ncbi:hypothetical protein ACI2TP_21975 [Ralstonia nicotianae]
MVVHPTPDLSPELAKRIRLVRRDVSDLLFHFTRSIHPATITIKRGENFTIGMSGSASAVLRKILYESKLLGSSRWTYGENTICFTEAPIQEFNSIFSLVSIAASSAERPRYEPYGVAISKTWFFKQGGRPVIYDSPEAFSNYPSSLRYRFCKYDPNCEIDFTWEREWRISADELHLDPEHTLVVVPTSEEAFEVVYEFASVEADVDRDGSTMGAYHAPRWLAVSLDMFGFNAALDK